MSSAQQFDELKRRIWQITNDVRDTVDGWDFKQYVLGALFDRFISENFACYIEGGDESIHYAGLGDAVITDEIKDDAIKTNHTTCNLARMNMFLHNMNYDKFNIQLGNTLAETEGVV